MNIIQLLMQGNQVLLDGNNIVIQEIPEPEIYQIGDNVYANKILRATQSGNSVTLA